MPRTSNPDRDEIIYRLYKGLPINKEIKSYQRLGEIFKVSKIAVRDVIIKRESKNKKG